MKKISRHTTALLIGAALALLTQGCGGDGDDGTNAAAALTETTTQAPGDICPNGGVLIRVGL